MKRLKAVLSLLVLIAATRAEATPLLQLDMRNGVYDPVTQTIFAPGGTFTLYALLTPTSSDDLTALLNDTYYLSIALTPGVSTPQDLGSFTFGPDGGTQTNIAVTTGMTYGTPPLDLFTQAFDPGDLPKHSVYPTYFTQRAFQFLPQNTATAYDTALNPGGLTPNPQGTAYYAAFTGDSSLLAAGYDLHFDLYSTCVTTNTCRGTDVDITGFAPFSHDAQTGSVPAPVPEPATLLLLGSGLVAGVFVRKRRQS